VQSKSYLHHVKLIVSETRNFAAKCCFIGDTYEFEHASTYGYRISFLLNGKSVDKIFGYTNTFVYNSSKSVVVITELN